MIQGSGADALKDRLFKLYSYLIPFKSRIIQTIHDEVQVEIHEEELAIVSKIKEIMEEDNKEFFIAMECDVEVSKNN